MNIYIVMLIGGLIGIILHSFKAMRDINKKNPLVHFNIVFKEYWSSDWFAVIGSLFCFGVLLFVSSEFVNLKIIDNIDYTEPLKERLLHFKIANFIKVTSVIAGYFSDSIIYGFLGVTEKNLITKFGQLEELPKPDIKP